MTTEDYAEQLSAITAFVSRTRVGGREACTLYAKYWRLAMDGDRDHPELEVLPLNYDASGYLVLGQPRKPAKILDWRPGPVQRAENRSARTANRSESPQHVIPGRSR